MKRLFTAFSLAALVSLGLPATGNLSTMALLAPSRALAAPPLEAAARLCAAQEGTFNSVPPAYHCLEGNFSDAQLSIARTLCEHAYQGDFSGVPGSYHCFNIPSTR
jgi:hypothetical protein